MSANDWIPDFLAAQAQLRPDAVAMEVVRDGRCLTYCALSQRADAAAALLRRRGVGEGERVAILCRNRPEFFELLFACGRIGAILVPLNWRMTAIELDEVIADCAPALLLCGREDEALARSLAAVPPLLLLDGEYENGLDLSGSALRREWAADGIWYLMYTSGTTGAPKGVIYTFAMALANYVNLVNATGLSAADTTLNYLPLFHTAGVNLLTLPALIAGGRVLVLERFDAEQVVRLLEGERIDCFFGVPTVYKDLLDHPRFADAPLGHVRQWISGGGPLQVRIAERFRDLGLRLCNGMGMTETGPTAFLQQPADAWTHIGSVGKPQLLCRMRIVTAAGEEAGAHEVGEILFAGPGVTPGYWNGEATGAWLASGDLGRRDADGCYHVVGRRAEMFVSGGENVSAPEVEAALCAHPAVADAAVVPVADDRWGEVGHAFVALRPGAEWSPEGLQAHCRQRLADYKVPKRFERVADFPRTASGKIRKSALVSGAGSTGGDDAGSTSEEES